jgi:hypothetical protein
MDEQDIEEPDDSPVREIGQFGQHSVPKMIAVIPKHHVLQRPHGFLL